MHRGSPRFALSRLLLDGVLVVHFPFGEVGVGGILGAGDADILGAEKTLICISPVVVACRKEEDGHAV